MKFNRSLLAILVALTMFLCLSFWPGTSAAQESVRYLVVVLGMQSKSEAEKAIADISKPSGLATVYKKYGGEQEWIQLNELEASLACKIAAVEIQGSIQEPEYSSAIGVWMVVLVLDRRGTASAASEICTELKERPAMLAAGRAEDERIRAEAAAYEAKREAEFKRFGQCANDANEYESALEEYYRNMNSSSGNRLYRKQQKLLKEFRDQCEGNWSLTRKDRREYCSHPVIRENNFCKKHSR